MYRQVKFVIWFPIVIAAAFVAGYLFWQKTLVPGPYDLEPVAVVRHQTADGLDTSNWQTYRNEKYGFEFRYPTSFVNKLEIGVNDYKEIEAGPGAFYEKLARDAYQSRLVNKSKYKIGDKCFDPDMGYETYDPSWINCKVFSIDPYVLKILSGHPSLDHLDLIIPTSKYETTLYFGKEKASDNLLNQILSTFKFITAETQKNEEKVCIQVITKARNPQTGEIRDFPTPCDVPEGWEVIK